MTTEMYRGPVLYIVHSPLFTEVSLVPAISRNEKLLFSQRNKIIIALQKAAMGRIPVIYEAGVQGREALEGFIAESLKALNNRLNPPAKKQLNVVWIDTSDKTTDEEIKKAFDAARIEPRKFITLGHNRDICVKRGVSRIHKCFPNSEIHLIEGTSTVFVKLFDRERKYKGALKKLGVQFSKKLNSKHFA